MYLIMINYDNAADIWSAPVLSVLDGCIADIQETVNVWALYLNEKQYDRVPKVILDYLKNDYSDDSFDYVWCPNNNWFSVEKIQCYDTIDSL